MDKEGNRAVIDFDNAYYCTAGATRYMREATAIQGFGRWHAALEGIEDIIFTRLISEGGDREFKGVLHELSYNRWKCSSASPRTN